MYNSRNLFETASSIIYPRLKVDFHCRVICTRVNTIEAVCESPRVNFKVERGSTFTFRVGFRCFRCVNEIDALYQRKSLTSPNFYLYARRFIQRKIYARTHVKITRQWKSNFTFNYCFELSPRPCLYQPPDQNHWLPVHI